MSEIGNELCTSKNIESAYNLIKKLKDELNQRDDLSKDTLSDTINEVYSILENNVNKNLEQQNNEKRSALIISSKTNKVVLPYRKEKVQKYIEYGKYETEEQVIENEYTVPLSRYKNESMSRVIEGYKLARIKEKNSIIDSLKYAMSLSLERRLHPAIITACDSIDELDIYLACLDENVPQLFDFFDIVFEYAPSTINIKQ